MTTPQQSRPVRGFAATCQRRLLPAVAAALSAVALGSCGTDANVDWAIIESGPGGDTLFVAPLTALRSCDGQPRVERNKSNANRVDVSLTVEQGDCGDEGARPATPLAIELAQPLRGQQITGKGMRPPSAYAGAKSATTIPSVVGFRIPDARAVLEARGLEIGPVVGPTIDATEVTSQSPPPGTPVPTSPAGAAPKVSLRTVPR